MNRFTNLIFYEETSIKLLCLYLVQHYAAPNKSTTILFSNYIVFLSLYLSAYPDLMVQKVTSHLQLHCMSMYPYPVLGELLFMTYQSGSFCFYDRIGLQWNEI